MVCSNVVKALFTLLRSGLWNKSIDDLSSFPLDQKDWESLCNIAIAQTIEGIIYDGIQKLPSEYFPSRSLLLNLVVRLNKIEINNKKMNICIQEQIKFFEKIEVKPILLKGQGIASYYPNATHRICGDIDWYFDDVQESKKVVNVLKGRSVSVCSSTIDSYNYLWRHCEVEHHSKLFDVFNPIAKYKLDNIKDKFLTDSYAIEQDTYQLNILPANLNIIQVNLHILKHLLSFGIGLRQFCDSAILYAKLEGQYDQKWLFKVYKDIGVVDWIYVLHELLVRYIGLSDTCLPFPLKDGVSAEWMLEDVLSTGNFGFYDEKYSVLQNNKTIERRNKSGRLWYSFRQYFPLAPYEAISFPVVHFCERFKSLTFG